MADIPTLEPAPADGDAGTKIPGRRSWLLVGAIIAIVLAGCGGAAWYFLHGGDGEAQASRPPAGPPLYVGLDPPFVVNFEAEQLVRFLQITVQVMSRDAATIELIRANDPVVRNDLLLLFGNQKYSSVSTREGKEGLRADALKVVRRVVAAGGGKPELVEAVYFTSFVMQ